MTEPLVFQPNTAEEAEAEAQAQIQLTGLLVAVLYMPQAAAEQAVEVTRREEMMQVQAEPLLPIPQVVAVRLV